MDITEIVEMMENNYLYIFGVLVIFIVFIYFYYTRMSNSSNETTQIQQLPNVECDGDKCFVKENQSKYDKCDDE